MKTLFRNATVSDKNSSFNGKKVDILIASGKIEKIASSLNEKADEEIDLKGAFVSPGFLDLQASYCDPGLEHKETLKTGAAAAVKGGFTHVLVMPDSQPVMSGKTIVDYISNHSKSLPVNMIPCGSVSQKFDGENLAEMYDMWQSGARAFFDVNHYVRAGLMSRALLYAKNFGGKVFSLPYDPSLAPGGLMHEGVVSTSLGLKGIPELAEEIVVQRDLHLAAYHNAPVHFAGISAPRSFEYISEAIKKGTDVTSHLPAYLLFFTDEDLTGFDTHLKVIPPLRSAGIKDALIDAVVKGKCDAIASHHTPQDTESKSVEFDHAEFGMIAQETAFSAAFTVLERKMKVEEITALFSHGPRRVLGLPEIKIESGYDADLSIFSTNEEWVYAKSDTRSLSANTPFEGKKLKGKIIGTFTKGSYNKA
ncbi:MAG: dihydroorotase [Flavobacteriales bacterium]